MKSYLSALLQGQAIYRHKSRVGWRIAPRYTAYAQRAKREAPAHPDLSDTLRAAVNDFRRDGIASFWSEHTAAIADAVTAKLRNLEAEKPIWSNNGAGYDTYTGDDWRDFPEFEQLFAGELGDFLHGYFQSGFKIFRDGIYRTEHIPNRGGSQLWHSDGGPGICVNVMFYLHDVTPEHGALEALPWTDSLSVFRKEMWHKAIGKLDDKSADRRNNITSLYAKEIEANHAKKVVQPVGKRGLVVPFLNNTIHRGGYPAEGLTRTAIVWHTYPSHTPTNLARYRETGIVKQGPYPKDPAMIF